MWGAAFSFLGGILSDEQGRALEATRRRFALRLPWFMEFVRMSGEAKGGDVMDDVRKCQFVSSSSGLTDWMRRDALCVGMKGM